MISRGRIGYGVMVAKRFLVLRKIYHGRGRLKLLLWDGRGGVWGLW